MATDELDILSDTTAESTGLEDTTTLTPEMQSHILTTMANQGSAFGIDLGGEILNEGRPPTAIQGEDGKYYLNNEYIDANGNWQTNPDFDTPVYFFHQPLEVGNARGIYADYSDDLQTATKRGSWMTEEQIKSYWDGTYDTGSINMDVFKEQHPNMTFDQYMSFIDENTQLHGQGFTIEDNPEMFSELTTKYGIQTSFQGDSGHVWGWNGSNYEKTYHQDKGFDVGGVILGVAAGVMTGGVLAGPLTSALGSIGITGSAATAAVAGISSAASQLITTGEVDLKQAIISAAIGYGGDKLGSALEASTELEGALGEVSNTIKETTNTFKELITTDIPIADAAIKAGGMSVLTQLVTTGDVNIEQAATAALIGGGIEFFNQLKTGMSDAGIPEDEYMADLLESEEFTQAAIDADIKDPFLNPNYTTVGDGLMVNTAGDVFNYAGDSIGNMSTLDTNNDGQLSGIDLEEITTDVAAKNIYNYQMDDVVYVDENGVPVNPKLVRFSGDDFVGYDAAGNQVTVTQKYYDEVFGGGKGDLVWTSEGGTDGYISYETGELAYKKVTTTQTLYDAEGSPYESEVTQWVDAQGNVVDNPQTVDELTMIAAKAIDEPLESVTYFDQDGNAINYKYPPAGLQDNFVQGQFAGLIFGPNGEISEVWYDPQTNTEYVRAQGTTEITAIRTPDTPPETVETETTTTDTTQATTAGEDGGGVEVASTAAEDVAGAGTSQEVSTAINNAVNQGASSSALSAAINAALLAGIITPEQAAAAYDSIGTIDITSTPDGVPVDAGSEVAVDTTTGGGLLTGGVTTGGVDTSVSTTTGADAGTVTGDVTGGVTGGDVTGGTTTEGEVTTGGTATTDTSGTGGSDVVDAGVIGTVVAGTVTGSEDPGAGSPGTDGQDGTGSGGGGDRDREDRRTAASGSDFERYDWQGLTYTTPTIQEMIQNPNVDYMAPINNVINQGMFGKYI